MRCLLKRTTDSDYLAFNGNCMVNALVLTESYLKKNVGFCIYVSVIRNGYDMTMRPLTDMLYQTILAE